MTCPRTLTCQDCGTYHYVDTSIDSETWNAICRQPGNETGGPFPAEHDHAPGEGGGAGA